MAEKNAVKSATGLPSNTAAALAYVFVWVGGLVFLLIEKDDKFVRFHAMQSLLTFGGLTILSFVPIIGWILSPFLLILGLVLWLVLIFKAYQGEEFKLPIVGNFAAKKTK